MLVNYDFVKEGVFKPIFSKSFDFDLDGDKDSHSFFSKNLDSIIESLEILTGSKVLVKITRVSIYSSSSNISSENV